MKRIDIAMIVSGLAMMGLSGYMVLAFPEITRWLSLSVLGAMQTLAGTVLMIMRQFKRIDAALRDAEESRVPAGATEEQAA